MKVPQVVAASQSAMGMLGAPSGFASDVETSGTFAEELAANTPMPGATPAAHCYCGHQFGHFAGQLGDGAAMYVGTVTTPSGDRLEVQFKGSGLTPYSRSADGRKVLRSSLREYMASEHMAALGIPTTRAGSVVTSDSRVMRDPQYDGHPVNERCTIITRMAQSFLRFGSFEVVKGTDAVTGQKGPSPGDTPLLKRLLDVTAREYFPALWSKHRGEDALFPLPDSYQGWDGSAPVGLGAGAPEASAAQQRREAMVEAIYREVARRTAKLVAQWQAVGWCHGVLNTDNMSIVGLTIDYGPYGFLDATDLDHICNGSDNGGRYTYAKQPEMCKWNLGKLAEVWRLVAPTALAEENMEALLEAEFDAVFAEEHTRLFANKLGLTLVDLPAAEAAAAEGGHAGTAALVHSLMNVMQATGADFTSTFRALTRVPVPQDTTDGASAGAGAGTGAVPGGSWVQVQVQEAQGAPRLVRLPLGAEAVLDFIVARCRTLDQQRAACASSMPDEQLEFFVRLLKAGDPRIRPHTAAIVKEIQNRQKAAQLDGLQQAGLDAANKAAWADWISSYAARLGADLQAATQGPQAQGAAATLLQQRHEVQLASCPRYILRNYIAEACISAAEKGEYAPTRKVMALLSDPYDMGTPPSKEAFLSGFSPQLHCMEHGGDAVEASRAGYSTPPDTPSCSIKGQVEQYDEVPPRWAASLCVTCSS